MQITDQETLRSAPGTVSYIDLTMKTQHLDFLHRVSERNDCSLSRTLDFVIRKHAEALIFLRGTQSVKMVRKHVSVTKSNLLFIDRLAMMWGMTRSGTVRRLLDEALASDKHRP